MKEGKTTAVLLLIAAVLIVIGIVVGQNTAVLEKAARICMECVGIG